MLFFTCKKCKFVSHANLNSDLNVLLLSHFSFRDDTHKVDVINFAQNKATQCFKNENLIDKESASLLWDFIVLLCRQNGVCLTA